jgi:hypothetical protein
MVPGGLLSHLNRSSTEASSPPHSPQAGIPTALLHRSNGSAPSVTGGAHGASVAPGMPAELGLAKPEPSLAADSGHSNGLVPGTAADGDVATRHVVIAGGSGRPTVPDGHAVNGGGSPPATSSAMPASAWSEQEDQQLLQLMLDGSAGSWDNRAAIMDVGRSGNALAHRWRKLRKKYEHLLNGHASSQQQQQPQPLLPAQQQLALAPGPNDHGLFGVWPVTGAAPDVASEPEEAEEGQSEEYLEMVMEELFLNEHVATSVAELVAEQAAWGTHITHLQVFDSLLDMVHASLIVHKDRTASLAQIARFCACCRWLKDGKASRRVNAFASFQSDTTFKTMLVQRALNNIAQFERIADEGGIKFRQTAAMASFVPKTSRVSLSRGLLRTRLWSELTQRALNDRSSRVASSVLNEQQLDVVAKIPPTAVSEQETLTTELRVRAAKIVELVVAQEGAEVFKDAVDPDQFPEYYAVVKKPMDLGSILDSLKGGRYAKIATFADDMRLVFRNSLLVNAVDSDIFKLARTFLAMFEHLLAAFVLNDSLDMALLDSYDPCQVCRTNKDEETANMLLCDGCDAAYHIHCLDPPLEKVPEEEWFCEFCASRRKGPHVEDCKFCHAANMPPLICRVDLGHTGKPWCDKAKKEAEKATEKQKQAQAKLKSGKPKIKSSKNTKRPSGILPLFNVNYTRDEAGNVKCLGCGKLYSSETGLKGHFTKGCDAGKWSCEWCKCSYHEASGRSPGPNGTGTLCAACSSRYRAGHTGPPKRDVEGNYLCEACGAKFETIRGLGSHRRGCSGGNWRCEWCAKEETETAGKAPGPNGPKTLCSTCGSRFRTGHTKMVQTNADGKYVCTMCEKQFDSIVALGGHKRYCDGGNWNCAWCKATSLEASGKSPGPDGPKTLCAACSARWRAGHTGMPQQDEEGNYLCQACGATFETIRGLGSHRRGCSGGNWRCEWCAKEETETAGKAPGPNGPKTLCSTCGSRFRTGHTKMVQTNADGKFMCEHCSKLFDTMVALGGHRRYCDGGKWRCNWCDCTYEIAKGKAPGPDGSKTLCAACGSRFRAGHSGPPKRDDDGMYVCPTCHKRFGTIPALGGHRRYCDPEGKHDSLHNDDLELFSETLIADQAGTSDAAAGSAVTKQTAGDTPADAAGGSPGDTATTGASQQATGDGGAVQDAGKLESDDLMLAPKPRLFQQATSASLDMMAIIDWLHRFSSDLDLPVFSVKQLFTLLTDGDPNQDTLSKLHVRLLQILINQMEETSDVYYNVNLKIAKNMLDDVTWPEILRLRISQLEKSPVNQDIKDAINAVHTEGYTVVNPTYKLCILGYLITEVLSTVMCKDLIDDAQEQVEKIEQDRMRFGMNKKRRANEKEVIKWVGKRVVLACGSLGVVESGTRGVFRIKLDHPEGMVGIKIGKPDGGEGKRDKGGICIRRPNEMKMIDDEDSGASPTQSPQSKDTDGKSQSMEPDTGEGQNQEEKDDLKLEPEEEKLIEKQNDLLEKLSIRTEPLGLDRYYNQYWWFPSNPSRVYIEDRGGLGHNLPLNVEAFMAADGSILERRAAAHQAVCAQFDKMTTTKLHSHFDAAKIDRTDLLTKEQLISSIRTGPLSYKMHTVAVQVAEEETARQQLSTAPIQELKDGLTAFNIDIPASEDREELVQLVVDHKLTRRIKCRRSEFEPLDRVSLHSAESTESAAADSTDTAPTFASIETDSKRLVPYERRGEHQWMYYDRPDQIDTLLKYLNPSGPRERQLKERIEVLYTKITSALSAGSEQSEQSPDGCGMPEDICTVDQLSHALPLPAVNNQALDKAKDLMVKVRETNVAVTPVNKAQLVQWFKNLLAADTWDLMLPLVLELADFVNTSAQNCPAFNEQLGLSEQWMQWLGMWRRNLQYGVDSDSAVSAGRVTFALYAFREVRNRCTRLDLQSTNDSSLHVCFRVQGSYLSPVDAEKGTEAGAASERSQSNSTF